MSTKLALQYPWLGHPAFTTLILCESHTGEAKSAAIPESVIFINGDRCDVCKPATFTASEVLDIAHDAMPKSS